MARSLKDFKYMTVDVVGTLIDFAGSIKRCLRQIGDEAGDTLHVAQSQDHDIGISRKLGMTNCWIERRHAQKGYGGTIEPENFNKPDFHCTSMAGLAGAVEQSLAA